MYVEHRSTDFGMEKTKFPGDGVVTEQDRDQAEGTRTIVMYYSVALARALDERMWQLNRAGRAPVRRLRPGARGGAGGRGLRARPEQGYPSALLPRSRPLPGLRAAGAGLMLSLLAKAGDPSPAAARCPPTTAPPSSGSSPTPASVATQLPHATGTAYAAKLRRTGQVTVTCFGEGGAPKATSTKPATSPASTSLPVVFFCENNRYAISVPQNLQMAIDNVADRAAGYGFPGVVVDGTDPARRLPGDQGRRRPRPARRRPDPARSEGLPLPTALLRRRRPLPTATRTKSKPGRPTTPSPASKPASARSALSTTRPSPRSSAASSARSTPPPTSPKHAPFPIPPRSTGTSTRDR